MTLTLVQLHISPWSERARWALDHHGLEFRKVEHVPMFGERRLRQLTGRRQGRVTAPVLIDGDAVIADSWDIARHADRIGSGSRLIPDGQEAEIQRWNELAEATMPHARAQIVVRMQASPEALDETLPGSAPRWVRRLARPLGRQVMRWFGRKYAIPGADAAAHQAKIREGLMAVRAAISGESSYLLGSFSYADIIVATMLQAVRPVDDAYLRLRPATREVWTSAELAAEFADLIAWRDALYRRHRRPAKNPQS